LVTLILEYQQRGDNFITAILIGLPLIAFLLYPLYKTYPLRRDIGERTVWQIQGIANVPSSESPYFRVNNYVFYLPPQVLKCFNYQSPYVIYYLPRSKALVSVEVMER
jgi:hypothetical protein